MNQKPIVFTSTDYPTGNNFIDLTGKTFGKVYVESYAGKVGKKVYYNCVCSCENKTRFITAGTALSGGYVKSCGCAQREIARSLGKANQKYFNNEYNSKIHNTWRAMKRRCYAKNDINYPNYGGRGITVCEDWRDPRDGFMNFYNWSLENGYEEGKTIDRIDSNGNYEPSNCRWVDRFTQSGNRINVKYASYIEDYTSIGKGKVINTLPIYIWAQILGINKLTLLHRLNHRHGMTVNQILSLPPDYNFTNGCKPKFRIIVVPQEYVKYDDPNKFESSFHD